MDLDARLPGEPRRIDRKSDILRCHPPTLTDRQGRKPVSEKKLCFDRVGPLLACAKSHQLADSHPDRFDHIGAAVRTGSQHVSQHPANPFVIIG